MDDTPNLRMPYIMAAQAQKHITHNEALRVLDCLVQLSVRSRNQAAPPAAPADGDRYIVAASPTGAWAGKGGKIAAWQDNAWAFAAPAEGWSGWVCDEDKVYVFDGAAWTAGGGGGAASVNPTPMVGVNATADTVNRLSVKSPASLFDNDGNGHQIKINKAAPGDTNSIVFQTAYAGRAEMGLAGDDQFHVKVSANGTTWTEALVIDRTTGVVSMPQTPAAGQVNADWAAAAGAARILNKPALAAVATSGSYADLSNPPALPPAQVPADWTAAAGVSRVLNKPPLGTAAGKDTGTAAGQIVVLDAGAKLPPVDGSQLINLPAPGGAAVNPNLLINGDFQVNQRAFAGGALAAAAFGFDRWKADAAGANATLSGYVLTLASGTLVQAIEPAMWGTAALAATVLTVSAESPTADLAVAAGSATGTITAGTGRRSVTLTTAAGDTGALNVRIAKAAAGTVSFGRVKVEQGAAATAWQPRAETQERRFCQRYFYRRSGAIYDVLAMQSAFTPNAAWGPLVIFPVRMRAVPTVTVSNVGHLTCYVSAAMPVTSIGTITATQDSAFSGSGGNITFAGTVAVGAAVMLYFNTAAGYIDASAEL
jgi:hypothetical protein